MKIEDLNPNPRNPRKITNEKLDMLKSAVAEFGDLGCVVFNRQTKQLVGGHQRVKVLDQDTEIVLERLFDEPTRTGTVAEGYIEVDGERFKYREVDWDEVREKAANIAANKHGGEFDLPILSEWLLELDQLNYNMDLTGFTPTELEAVIVPVEKLEPQADEDDVPGTSTVQARTKLGDVYELGRHRLRCGDCTNMDDMEALFGEETAELCFTSPPYADQREYNGGKELSTEHLATFIRAAFGKAKYFAVNLGYSRKGGEVNPYWEDYLKEAKACGLRFLSWNVWDKGQAGSIGNQSAMFAITHEWIFVFGPEPKELNKTHENKWAGEVKDSGVRQADGTVKNNGKSVVNAFSNMQTVFSHFPYKARNEDLGDHPAVFPVGLPESYIEAMTSQRDSVYEPFGGSGTTMIAAEKTGRRCFMMELDPKYCDVIVARWEKYTGKKAVLLGQPEELEQHA